ncbi:MAG: DUF3090 family protein [Dehalococcoidia bacterium]
MSQDDRAHVRHDIGVCAVLEPEAVGAPGERRFRLRVAAEHGSALLWLEKEELYDLALTIKRMLRTSVLPTGNADVAGGSETRADFDFKVAGLALAHDRDSGRYMLLAHMTEEEDGGVALWADAELLNRMADRAMEVHDGGRPRCALCGAPIRSESSHACPRAN